MIMMVLPILNAKPDGKLLDTEGVLQLSVTVGATQVTSAEVPVVLTVIFAGQFVIKGGSESLMQGLATTVTLKVQTLLLPAESRAV